MSITNVLQFIYLLKFLISIFKKKYLYFLRAARKLVRTANKFLKPKSVYHAFTLRTFRDDRISVLSALVKLICRFLDPSKFMRKSKSVLV